MTKQYTLLQYALLLAAFASSTVSYGYTYTFKNETNQDLLLDLHGIAVVGKSLMQGKIPAWQGGGFSITHNQELKLVTVQNAGHFTAPAVILKGYTLVLNFNGIDFGICLNKSGIFINGVAHTMIPLSEDQYDALSTTVKNIEEKVTEYAPYAKQLPGQAGTYGGYAADAAPYVMTGIAKLARMSTCKNMSFKIIQGADGKFQVITLAK